MPKGKGKGKDASRTTKDPVRDMRLKKGMTVGELVSQMDAACGFSSKAIADGVSVLEDMIKEKGCIKFLSRPAGRWTTTWPAYGAITITAPSRWTTASCTGRA